MSKGLGAGRKKITSRALKWNYSKKNKKNTERQRKKHACLFISIKRMRLKVTHINAGVTNT